MNNENILDFAQQYEVFAQELLYFIGIQKWNKAYIKYEIYNQMISIERWFILKIRNFGLEMKF
ncbi:hypothetical protein [Moraxella catarrhalis]|uniref:hypothetical protein n=1 Tax=Moraxella catarrhalis TaxID=480 RepID=UPI000EA8AD21|nr:hypothetical protein [Moraxella catarrhalis]RKM38561.1 hypothetical protein D6D80_09040 [Moraxella catarrhalis]